MTVRIAYIARMRMPTDRAHGIQAMRMCQALASEGAEVTLYYQTTSKEYVEFLRDENATNSSGQVMYDAWIDNDKAPPEEMATAVVVLDAPLLGDVNCDGTVNALDIEPFLVALFDPTGYPLQYPDCDINLADINGDGSVNALDIEGFLNLLFP